MILYQLRLSELGFLGSSGSNAVLRLVRQNDVACPDSAEEVEWDDIEYMPAAWSWMVLIDRALQDLGFFLSKTILEICESVTGLNMGYQVVMDDVFH
jgi:hypothetical protein